MFSQKLLSSSYFDTSFAPVFEEAEYIYQNMSKTQLIQIIRMLSYKFYTDNKGVNLHSLLH